MDDTVTLIVAGAAVTFPRVEACLPPRVPVGKPGPCKGFKVPPAARKPRKKPFSVTGDPRVLTAREFEAQIPQSRRLYRGVATAAGADVTRRGVLGDGDYGRGIYTNKDIGIAQGYAGRGPGGVVLRLALARAATVRKPPRGVTGSKKINEWADEHGVDVVDVGHLVVRNPAVLVIDGSDYTARESVVLDYLERGFQMPEGYQPEIEALRRGLGIDIPDVSH